MLRSLAFFLLTLYVTPVQTYAQPDKTQRTAKKTEPSPPVSPIAPEQSHGQGFQPEADKHVNADVRVVSNPQKDNYDRAAFWANIVLAFVGIGGIVVASITLCRIHRQAVEMRLQRILMQHTLRAIRRQANTMDTQAIDARNAAADATALAQSTLEALKRQAAQLEVQSELMQQQSEVQRAGMKQWVELEGWSSELFPGGGELKISFRVSNPTNYLLTAEHGEFAFTRPAMSVLFIYRPAPLAPANPLKFTIAIPLSQAAVQSYFSKTIGFSLNGHIAFTSALDQKVVQHFSGILTCNPRETKFEATVVLRTSDTAGEQEEEQANPN